jgi:hypothetical protein
MTVLEPIKQTGTVIEIDARKRAATCTALGKLEGLRAVALERSSQQQFQSLLYQRGESRVASGCLCLHAFEQRLV